MPGSQQQEQAVVAPRFRDFGKALGYNFTKGLFSLKNLEPLVLGTMGTGAVTTVDDEVTDALRDSANRLGEVGDAAAYYVVGGTTGSLLLLTPFIEHQKFRAFTFTLTHAVILNNTLALGLKAAVSRTRPNMVNDNSFPSAHTSNSVAFATVVAKQLGNRYGLPFYIVAGAIALSRLEQGAHWLSDLTAGATIGYISGITAARGTKHVVDQRQRQRQWAITPTFGRHHVGFVLRVHF